MQSANPKSNFSKTAIIAGRGVLPKIIADKLGNPFIINFNGDENEILPANYVGNIGQIGKTLEQLKKSGAKKVVFAGSITKPSLTKLKLDMDATRLLGKAAISAIFGKLPGDDALFKMIIKYLEDNDLKIIGADEVAPELLAGEGALGKITPDALAMADILEGCKAAKKLGEDDIGQAVVCAGREIIATEDVHGTDNLLERAAAKNPQNAVLVKCMKPQQDRRIDLPSIGVQTIERIASFGFAGVAVEAGHSLIIEKEKVRELADKLGVFVYGM